MTADAKHQGNAIFSQVLLGNVGEVRRRRQTTVGTSTSVGFCLFRSVCFSPALQQLDTRACLMELLR